MTTWSKEAFANNLKNYMGVKGINQKELAEIIGVSAPTINDWLKTKKYPRIDKIEKLANYFGILKSDLIESHNGIAYLSDDVVGKTLKEARQKLALTIPEFAEKSGVSPSVIRSWERGNTLKANRRDIESACDFLGVSPFLFLNREEGLPDNYAKDKETLIKYLRLIHSLNDLKPTEKEIEEIIDFAKYVVSKRKLN